MALKVGDLYVSLTANTQKLQKQLDGAAKQVERFGRQMKSLGKDASEMSNVVVAAMAAVFAAASSKDAKNLEVKKQLEDLKTQSVALASEIAQAAMPVLQQMTDFVGRLITAFQQMTPAQKEILVSFLQGAMAVSALGMAAVKLEPAFKLGASAISFAGTAMSGLGTAVVWVQGALAALGIGFLPLVASIAAFVFVAGFVRQAWAENLGGIQEKFAAVWGWISEKAREVGKFLMEVASWYGSTYRKIFDFIADKYTWLVKQMIQGAATMARALGMDALFDVNGLEKAALQLTDVAREGMLDGALAIGTAAIDGVKVLGSGLGTALEFSGQGLSKIADDVTKKVGAVFSGFRLPAAAKVPITLSAEKEKAEKVAKAAPVKVDYGRLRADKMEDSFRALAGIGGNLRDSLEMAGALEVPRQLEEFSGDALKSVKGIEDVRDFLHKIGGSAGEAEKYLAAWEKWNEDQRKAAQHVDRLRADRAPVAAQQFLAGGTFGDAARMAGVTSGIPAALEGLSGATLTTVSAWEDLEDQIAQVRDLNPVVREFYDASRKTFEDALAKQKELEEARKSAVTGFKDQVMGSFGKLGGILSAATGPLAQALGPIGALLGVVLELLKGSKGFENLVSALDGIMQGLSDALGQLFDPVAVVVNALQPVVAALGSLVSQVLPLLTSVLQPLLPVFVVLGTLLMALSPVLALVVEVVKLALIPVLFVLEQAMRAAFGAIKTVAYIILGVTVGVLDLWNGIVSAVQAVLTYVSAFEIAGQRPLAFLGDMAASLEAAKGPADQYRQQLADVAAVTWDSAMTTAQSFNSAAAAADSLASGMTNAASGFKVDLARYNATNVGATPGAPMEATGVGYYGDTFVTIVSNDPEAIWGRMEDIRRRKSFQAGRGPIGGFSPAGA